MKTFLFALATFWTFAVIAMVGGPADAEGAAFERPKAWTAYQNKRLGFTIYYPVEWFKPDAEPAEKDGRSFSSPDGKARISAFGMLDPKWYGSELFDLKKITGEGRVYDELALKIYRGALSEEGSAYEGLSEKKMGKTWLTLSGKRGDQVFFEKYIFSCKDKVISVLAYSYPEAEQEKYSSILKTLLKRFGAGSGSDSPHCL